MMKIAVIGTGYVGLVTGTCLAETGNNVLCVDIDEKKVLRLQNGEMPIYEPGLDLLFHRNINQGRLQFLTDTEYAVRQSEIIFLALPTPPDADGKADLSFVLNVSERIAAWIEGYKIVVTKSTVPVGTADKVKDIFKQYKNLNPSADFEVDVVSNPEFLREGVAVDDFMKPDRVVVGTTSERARNILSELYSPYVRQGNPVIFMDERSSELTKYAANSFLATKISFMNEIANLCELVGADVDAIRMGIGSDTRIGKRFLFPGIGYGGSCFPKDVQALSLSASEYKYDFKILNSVIKVNEGQRLLLYHKIKNYFNGDLNGKKFAIWGLAFKPETDDVREAPALFIIESLLKEGAEVCVYDPEAMENVKTILGEKLSYGDSPYDVLEKADALIIVTEWSVFRNPDFGSVKAKLKSPIIFDGRNLFDLKKMADMGFYYNSIGRKLISKNEQ